jgi:hypothetical protein
MECTGQPVYEHPLLHYDTVVLPAGRYTSLGILMTHTIFPVVGLRVTLLPYQDHVRVDTYARHHLETSRWMTPTLEIFHGNGVASDVS